MEMTYIGNKIRKARVRQKLTLQEMADQTQLSKSYISEVERAIANPSITSLKRIANVLNISMAKLFEDGTNGEIVIRKDKRKKLVSSKSSKVNLWLMAEDSNRNMEPIYAVLEPGADSGEVAVPHTEGEEFTYVLKGRVCFYIGDQTYDLEEGDSIYFDATIPHRYANPYDNEAILLAIACPPGF